MRQANKDCGGHFSPVNFLCPPGALDRLCALVTTVPPPKPLLPASTMICDSVLDLHPDRAFELSVRGYSQLLEVRRRLNQDAGEGNVDISTWREGLRIGEPRSSRLETQSRATLPHHELQQGLRLDSVRSLFPPLMHCICKALWHGLQTRSEVSCTGSLMGTILHAKGTAGGREICVLRLQSSDFSSEGSAVSPLSKATAHKRH